MSRAVVRSWWQNALAVICVVVMHFDVALFAGLWADAHHVHPPDGVVGLLALAVLASCAALIVRVVRIGVYAMPEGLKVVKMLRTRVFEWTSIDRITTYEVRSGRGTYYAPVIWYRDTVGRKRRERLWTLSTMFPDSAERSAERIEKMAPTGRVGQRQLLAEDVVEPG